MLLTSHSLVDSECYSLTENALAYAFSIIFASLHFVIIEFYHRTSQSTGFKKCVCYVNNGK